MSRNSLMSSLVLVVLLAPACACAEEDDWAATFYAARVATQPGWEYVIIHAIGTEFADAYLVDAALSRKYAERKGGALTFAAEGQVAYYFGDQTYWEFNAVPVVARWNKFPWSQRVATSAAFGLGLSYATELPQVEVSLESESHQWLVYWMMELTAGPAEAPWSVSLRLHHRSVAYGLMGDQGGLNAVGLGLRYRF